MYGHYLRNLDDKNRVLIPSKLREELGEVFYITIGPDKVLELRDEKSFSIYKDKIISTNLLNKNARLFARLVLGNTSEVVLDKQGRAMIPETFLRVANITKELVFVGVGNKVEIISNESFTKFKEEYAGESSIDDLAEKLLKDGIEL